MSECKYVTIPVELRDAITAQYGGPLIQELRDIQPMQASKALGMDLSIILESLDSIPTWIKDECDMSDGVTWVAYRDVIAIKEAVAHLHQALQGVVERCEWHEAGTLLRASCDEKHRGHSQRPDVCPYCHKKTVFGPADHE